VIARVGALALLLGLAACHRRGEVVVHARPFTLRDGGTARAMRFGFARVEGGVLRVVVSERLQLGCPERGEGARVEVRVPSGPRGDFFAGEPIGVRVEVRDGGARGAFGLDAEEATLRLASVGPRVGANVRGSLRFDERYARSPGPHAHGAGAFDVTLCAIEPHSDEPAARTNDLDRAVAHVALLPDGRRALTKLRFGDVVVEHPGGAAEGRVRLAVAEPLRVRTPEGAVSYDGWATFDAIDFARGGHVRGRVHARAPGVVLRGAFDAIVE
jgi:hypothetical protein